MDIKLFTSAESEKNIFVEYNIFQSLKILVFRVIAANSYIVTVMYSYFLDLYSRILY